jgi:hypothetical protein
MAQKAGDAAPAAGLFLARFGLVPARRFNLNPAAGANCRFQV